jgi:hypothetical protein
MRTGRPPLSAALPELLEAAAQLAAAQGDDRVSPGDGPMHPGALASRVLAEPSGGLSGQSTPLLLAHRHTGTIHPQVQRRRQRLDHVLVIRQNVIRLGAG